MKHIKLYKSISFLLLIPALLFLTAACGDMIADDDDPESMLQRYGHEYEVWADNGLGPLPTNCYDPYTFGYTYIGTGYSTQYFASGLSSYYAILTKPGNFAFVDAVQDNSGNYLYSYSSCNTNDEWNVSDSASEPDNSFAWVGTEHANDGTGILLIGTVSSTSINVFIAEDAYYWHE